VIDTLPRGRAHRDVTHQTHRSVFETLADVDDLAIGVRVWGGMGALRRRIGDVLDEDEGLLAVETYLTAEPFVSAALSVEAVGGEGVAVRADGAPLVVVATHGPLRLVVVGGMGAKVDDAAGVEMVVDHAEEHLVTEASVTGDGFDAQRRIEGRELG
jgi:hypothetical protein